MSKEQYFLQSASEEALSEDDDVPLVSVESLFFRKYFCWEKCDLFLKFSPNFIDKALDELSVIVVYSVLGAENAKAGRERR